MHHLMCPRRPHRAPTTLVIWPLPSLQGSGWNFHQSPSECHFSSTCLGEPGDSPSSRVPRRIAESPGLAEATDVTQASSLRPSNLPFLIVIHSGCLPPAFPTGTQYRSAGVQGPCCLWLITFGLLEFHTPHPTPRRLPSSPPATSASSISQQLPS